MIALADQSHFSPCANGRPMEYTLSEITDAVRAASREMGYEELRGSKRQFLRNMSTVEILPPTGNGKSLGNCALCSA